MNPLSGLNSQNDNGSLQQVALPAEGGSRGAPDSRSETLSPREWPTLEAEAGSTTELLRKRKKDAEGKKLYFDTKTGELLLGPDGIKSDARNIVLDQIYETGFFGRRHFATERRRRPRGESGAAERLRARQ